MDLKQLRYFVAVAERGSINAAAQVLHVAQSAVSRQMQNLEAEVGGLLFDRSVSGAAINESGQRLLERARFILGEVESARKDISALSRDVRGTVRLAAPSSIGHLMYVPVIQAMSAQYPQVQLQLTESSTEEVLRGLAAGALDFGIVTAPGDHPLLEFAPLFAEPALLVCRRDDPLARRRRIASAAVKELPLVISAGLRRIFSERFGTLTPAVQLDSIDAAVRLTLAGSHYAVLPKSALHSNPVARQLGFVPIDGFGVDRVLAQMRGRPESLAAHALRTTVMEQVKGFSRARSAKE